MIRCHHLSMHPRPNVPNFVGRIIFVLDPAHIRCGSDFKLSDYVHI